MTTRASPSVTDSGSASARMPLLVDVAREEGTSAAGQGASAITPSLTTRARQPKHETCRLPLRR